MKKIIIEVPEDNDQDFLPSQLKQIGNMIEEGYHCGIDTPLSWAIEEIESKQLFQIQSPE